MKHTAIYMRVSSKAQDTASQEPELKRYATAQEGEAVWYRDTFTGKSMDRKGWNRLMEAVRAGSVSRVVVWRLDRLGRTAKGLTALFEELIQRKVNLVSLKDGIDLNTPAGRLMANVLASVAQYETEVRAERVLAGQAVARAKGKTWGGSDKGRRLKVTDEQVMTIRRMAGEGAKVAAIARATGLTRPTVYAYLAEPVGV
jgi:DNA invertase Pin-like site-specific DNA recombinase